MLRFWLTVFRSSKFMNKLANEIGVDRGIYKTALTEAKVNFALYESMYSHEMNDKKLITQVLALKSCLPALAGVTNLYPISSRTGNMNRVFEFENKVIEYCFKHEESFKNLCSSSGKDHEDIRKHLFNKLKTNLSNLHIQ